VRETLFPAAAQLFPPLEEVVPVAQERHDIGGLPRQAQDKRN
jgi:hypothetical protein